MAKAATQNLYLDHLRDEGYSPRLDKDGDIVFKIEGRAYAILVDEDDVGFFQLVYPNFWSIESAHERQRVVAAAERATARTKVAKVYVVRDDVWASFEVLFPAPDQFKSVLPRAIRTLRTAVQTFREHMVKSQATSGVVGIA